MIGLNINFLWPLLVMTLIMTNTILPLYKVHAFIVERNGRVKYGLTKQPRWLASIQSTDQMSDATNSNQPVTKQQQQKQQKQQQQYKVPLSWDEMVRQVASCSKQAAGAGVNKQIVRILLPRDSTSGDFGKYLESSNVGTSNNQGDVKLVPPDESWQGGIMQLYRAAAPTAMEIVRTIQQNKNQGIPSRLKEDRSVDESGVDGVGLITTDDQSITCWIQPTQENADEFIQTAQRTNAEQTAILLNPQWRQVDDALDTASQNSANPFLQGLANFLGGKGAVLQRCADVGYTPVYTLEGYVCKGANVRLIQTFQQEWNVYVERDDIESYIAIGTSKTRPTYQIVEQMMTKSDIGYKYARDIGLQPKL